MPGLTAPPPPVQEIITTVPSGYGPVESDATAFEYDGGGGQYCCTAINKIHIIMHVMAIPCKK